MREEWNKGYEKGRDDYCCNQNCNQGRDCPLRKSELTDEAIITVADPLNLWDVPKDKLIEFARAILRKASEK
jgi:hypothetical protein